MREVVIVSGSRTAIGTFGSGLKDVPVVELGGIVMKDVLKKANLKPVAGVVAMETATGIQALYQGLSSGNSQVLVVEGELAKMKQNSLQIQLKV